ncbi:MAG TPA: zf-TFIIB domain-containing protein [Kofleriaceae bacterium]|nr:zf-TFIIB domain-containing protein [Kofleriaceae bacterium]
MSSPYRATPQLGCPRCRAFLDQRSAGQLRVLGCAPCRGMWLAHESVTRFLVASDEELETVSLADTGTFRPEPTMLVHPRLCPRCVRPMKRESLSRARVTVDLCPAHGMWFDAGELRAFVAALRDA